MMHKLIMLVLCVAPLSVWTPLAIADSEKVEDQVNYQVEVGRDVENDLVIAILSATAENRDPGKLAESINTDMSWALQKVRDQSAIKTQSGSYQTYPVYDDNKIVRWRGRQDLQLESGDVDVLSKALGDLQERLQIQSLQFSVSPEKRSAVESALIEEALAAFRKRAELVSHSLDADDYGLVDISIHTGGIRQPVPMRAEAVSLASRASSTAPAIEQGTSRVSVQVSGRIQLKRD
jgi:predicted secreted protein